MTPEQLDEIEKLAEAATPGPWSVDMHADVVADTVLVPAIPDDIEAGGLWPVRVAGFPYTYEGSHQRKDAAFIVAMREYALPLVKALREAWAEADSLSRDRYAEQQRAQKAEKERDEARAEVERLRSALRLLWEEAQDKCVLRDTTFNAVAAALKEEDE